MPRARSSSSSRTSRSSPENECWIASFLLCSRRRGRRNLEHADPGSPASRLGSSPAGPRSSPSRCCRSRSASAPTPRSSAWSTTLFLRPLPIEVADRVMRLPHRRPASNDGALVPSILNLERRARAEPIVRRGRRLRLRRRLDRRRERAAGRAPRCWSRATNSDALGVRPHAAASSCRRKTERPSAPRAVLHHDYWKEDLGAAVDAGDTLRVNGQIFTVIGIAPPGFDGLNVGFAPRHRSRWRCTGLFGPTTPPTGTTSVVGLFVHSVGRLRDGVDREARRQTSIGSRRASCSTIPTTTRGGGSPYGRRDHAVQRIAISSPPAARCFRRRSASFS